MTWRRWWLLTRGGCATAVLGVFLFLLAIWQDNPNVDSNEWRGEGIVPPDGDITSKLVGTASIVFFIGIVLLVIAGIWSTENVPPEKPDDQATEKGK